MIDFTCLYCGNHTRRGTLRDGWECTGCSAPALAPGQFAKVEVTPPPTHRGNFTYDGQGGIVEINELLREEWLTKQVVVDEIKLNAQDFVDVATLIIDNVRSLNPSFRTPISQSKWEKLENGMLCGWYFNKYAPPGGQLVKVTMDPRADGMVIGAWQTYVEKHYAVDGYWSDSDRRAMMLQVRP